MAEQHAVTFSAGLASQGLLPVVCIYSTFLQRSYDQIIHDVNLLKEKVIFAVDRAGLVPGDGETHQGVYDPAFFSQIGVPTWSPANYAELDYCLTKLISEQNGPAALRYPRGAEQAALVALGCTGHDYDLVYTAQNARAVIVSYGSETEDALGACAVLKEQGLSCDCCKLLRIYPLPEGICSVLSSYSVIVFAEECVQRGGIGEHLLLQLHLSGWLGKYCHCGVSSERLTHATVPELKMLQGLDRMHLAEVVKESIC